MCTPLEVLETWALYVGRSDNNAIDVGLVRTN